MAEEDLRIALARSRVRLRTIESELARTEKELRSFRSVRFGAELKHIQRSGLHDERSKWLKVVRELEGQIGYDDRRSYSLSSFLGTGYIWMTAVIDSLRTVLGFPRPTITRGSLRYLNGPRLIRPQDIGE